MRTLALLLTTCSLVLTASQVAAGDPAAGQAKAASCAGCHGMDGNSMVPTYPKLAGQHEAYLLASLKAYKGGQRMDPTMKAMVAGLTEADMANLAAYFASQSPR